MARSLPIGDLYWQGRFTNEYILEEYMSIYGENHQVDNLRFEHELPRQSLTSIYGEVIRIPILFDSDNAIQKNNSPVGLEDVKVPLVNAHVQCNRVTKEILECSVCYLDFSVAYKPDCAKTTCKNTWFCAMCLKKHFVHNTRFFLECVHCISKMNRVFDNHGNEVDFLELIRRCNFTN